MGTNWGLIVFRTDRVQRWFEDDAQELKISVFFIGILALFFLLYVIQQFFLSTPGDLIEHQDRAEEIEKFLIINALKNSDGTSNIHNIEASLRPPQQSIDSIPQHAVVLDDGPDVGGRKQSEVEMEAK